MAIEVVERVIEVVTVEKVDAPAHASAIGSVEAFVPVLRELARQLDTGRIYDRDLAVLDAPITELLEALTRRHKRRPAPSFVRRR